MDRIAPAFASLTASMVRRPAWAVQAAETAHHRPAGPSMSDIRLFLTAFAGGFLFFSVLIA